MRDNYANLQRSILVLNSVLEGRGQAGLSDLSGNKDFLQEKWVACLAGQKGQLDCGP